MATGTGLPLLAVPADQSPDELGENDLRVVFKALHSVAEKYKFLGVEMNVKISEVKKIQSQCSDPGECLLEVLSVRLKQIPSLTWRDIDTALRSDTVGEPQLADRIRRQYGHLYTPDPSFETSLVKERGRKMLEITKSKKKAKSARKYIQQDSDEEVSESERYGKSPKKLQMDVNEAAVKKTQGNPNMSPYTKRHSKPEKEYNTQIQHEGYTQRKKKATKYKESEVVCGSQHRHKVKYSERRAQKQVQIESESKSSASSSEQEIIQVNNSDSTEESYSSEQEESSAEEVSETERYQKPSEQPREDEYPHSHRETPVRRIKGKRGKSSDLAKTRFESQSKPEVKAKRKKKAADQSVSKASQHEIASDPQERIAQERKQKKSEKHSKKGVQKSQRENESESSAMRKEEERVSSSYRRGKSRKPKSTNDTRRQKQTQGKKLEYQTKAIAKKEVEKKVKETVSVGGEQSSDEEVREKPPPKSLRQKEVKTRSESEDESSTASTSDDQSNPHLHESTKIKEYHKVHTNSDGSEIKEKRAVKTKKKTQRSKQKDCRRSDTDIREQSKEGKRSIKINEKTKKVRKPEYLKADGTSPRKEREKQAKKKRLSKKKVAEHDMPSSESTQEDSEEDSYNSSEEEERNSEQKSSNEDEEIEPDDESSSAFSEQEVKRKPAVPYVKKRVKEIGGSEGKKVKMATDLPADEDQSDPDRDQEEHDIQQRKRSRRRHRESSVSPTTRGSSSLSTSQEDNQQQMFKKVNQKHDTGSKKQRRKEKRRKNEENVSSCSNSDDSSPECDMNKNLSKEEGKKLRNVFKRYFGQLCCEITDPVETAAQLQKKGLISQSMMKDMIMSPESQQAKKITLLSALEKKIKLHPDCIFTFIESLFENTALQKVGVEILTEAGKFFINL